MKNIFKVISFNSFLRIEKLKELLNKLWSNMDLQTLYIGGFIDDQLQEELIDTLKVRPWRVNFILLLNSSFRESKSSFFNIWQRSEDVPLDHLNHLIKVWNN